MRQQRVQQAAASIAAATPTSAVLGGRHEADAREAAARAAKRRANTLLAEQLAKEEEARAAARTADAQARAEAQATQARSRQANAARDAAEAAAAAERTRAAWSANGGALQEAFDVLCTHPHNAPLLLAPAVATLLLALARIRAQPHEDKYRSLNMHHPRFPNAHGALALLLALGFVHVKSADGTGDRLVLPAVHSHAALVSTIGQLEALQQRLTAGAAAFRW
jgi:hypothetical protein